MSWFGSLPEKKLKPSEILYSQDSISSYFDVGSNHPCQSIGETLDDLCEERCRISDIPRISVMNKGWIIDSWVSEDNRRLWVFRHLERLGRCDHITVNIVDSIPPCKLNSTIDGKTVQVRGDPGGKWHSKDRFSWLIGGILIAFVFLWWMVI